MLSIVLTVSLLNSHKFSSTYANIPFHIHAHWQISMHTYTCVCSGTDRDTGYVDLCYITKRWEIYYPEMSLSLGSYNVLGEETVRVGHRLWSRDLGLRPSTWHRFPSERCQDQLGEEAMTIRHADREPNWAKFPAAVHSYWRPHFFGAVSSQPVTECVMDARHPCALGTGAPLTSCFGLRSSWQPCWTFLEHKTV